MDAAQWVTDEFAQIDFGDSRLHKRFLKVTKDFSRQPGMSTNGACCSWADTKAAYRMFDNPKVTPQAILNSHIGNVVHRADAFSVVLAVQDTCMLDFKNHKKTVGLGKISNSKHGDPEGLIMHTAYMLSPSGLPLGFGYQKFWARTEDIKIQPQDLWTTPIEQKESFKWLEAMMQVKGNFLSSTTKIVHVCDREADVYELFCEAERSSSSYIVRARHDRSVNRKNKLASSGQLIWDGLAKSEKLGTFSFEIAARQNRPERVAAVELKSIKFILSAPMDKKARKDTYTESIEMGAVQVLELNPPEGQEPLEWVLLTNLDISTMEAAERIAKWYSFRWRIEEFHRILKSGCKAEDCRMQTAAKLIKYLTVMTVIAWRIHWLTKLAREAPETPCNVVLSEAEWKGLCLVVLKDRKLLLNPPPLKTAIRAIASLGGFLGRKSDGDPGAETIWKGLHALFHIAKSWEALTK